jgi:hypothetical protein
VKIWIGGIVALLAAGIAIYLGTRSSGDDAPAPAPQPATLPAPQAPQAQMPAPSLPNTPPAGRTATDDGSAKTYQIEGITVHDHRGSNAGPPMDLPPNMHPPGSREIPVSIVSAFSKEVRRVVFDCTHDLPQAQRGPHSRVEGEIVIAIKDGKASVTKSLMQLRDTTGDVEQVRQCIEQHATGLSVDGEGQADLDGYSIHLQSPILGR